MLFQLCLIAFNLMMGFMFFDSPSHGFASFIAAGVSLGFLIFMIITTDNPELMKGE